MPVVAFFIVNLSTLLTMVVTSTRPMSLAPMAIRSMTSSRAGLFPPIIHEDIRLLGRTGLRRTQCQPGRILQLETHAAGCLCLSHRTGNLPQAGIQIRDSELVEMIYPFRYELSLYECGLT